MKSQTTTSAITDLVGEKLRVVVSTYGRSLSRESLDLDQARVCGGALGQRRGSYVTGEDIGVPRSAQASRLNWIPPRPGRELDHAFDQVIPNGDRSQTSTSIIEHPN